MSVLPYSRAGAVRAQVASKFSNVDIQETNYVYIRKLTANTNSFNINMTSSNTANQLPGEYLISQNDGAVLYGMSMSFAKVPAGTSGNVHNYTRYTYPDLQVFNGPAVGNSPTEAECLEAWYNSGTVQLKANSIIKLNNMTTSRFRVVPSTQFEKDITQASYNKETPRMVDIIQPQVLTGKDTIELIVSASPGADTSQIGGSGGSENFLVIEFAAFVLKNYAQSVTSGNLHQALSTHSTAGN